jgi:putative tryptophan/tyrosine transport system substrate-binding protein
MQRRAFLVALGTGLLVAPLATAAQEAGKLRRIGFLALNNPEAAKHLFAALRQGLRESGWVEGKNLLIEFRYADSVVERLPVLVAELIRLKVDIIVTGSSVPTQAAKDATGTIPIVMASGADALAEGFVTSLARPTGNITGMTALIGPEIVGKQMELLREVAPAASQVAALANPSNASHSALVAVFETAARAFGVQPQIIEAGAPERFEDAFATMRKGRAAALVVLTDAMFFAQRGRIADLAARNRLPTMYYQREFVDAGGLISYGPSVADMYRRAATHVDRILKGAKPTDLPVELPTKFDLVINLRTAKALGVTVVPTVLARADEVIE